MGRNNSPKNNFGFTLIELLVAIAIISVLSGTVIVSLNPALRIKQSRDKVRKTDLRNIQAALEMYRSDLSAYPTTGNFPACTNALTGGSPVVTYMQKIPCDPKGGSYTYVSTGITYTISACLEDVNDADKDTSNTCATAGTTSYTLANP